MRSLAALEGVDGSSRQRVQPLTVLLGAQFGRLPVQQAQVEQGHPHRPLVQRLQDAATHLTVTGRVVHEEGVVVRVDHHVEQSARLWTVGRGGLSVAHQAPGHGELGYHPLKNIDMEI